MSSIQARLPSDRVAQVQPRNKLPSPPLELISPSLQATKDVANSPPPLLCSSVSPFPSNKQQRQPLHLRPSPYERSLRSSSPPERAGAPPTSHAKNNKMAISFLIDPYFTCPTCGKAFRKVHYMLTHLASHKAALTFACSCGQKFKRLQDINRHSRYAGHTHDYGRTQ
ncbi:hypothetical protein BC830DRAFT_1155393 [Chytriomyces sp. MP71]|nr:hypothetical protein BC830DRAFT_1155393 [Chytriomyces sp. MP71]